MLQFGPIRRSPAWVAARQDRRLRALLRHAVEYTPFYRAKYGGIDLDHCSLTDLPTTSKAELMAHFDDAVADRAVTRAGLERFIDDPANIGRLFLGRYPVCHTSGSQGQPMLVVQDRFVLDLLFAFQMTRGNAGFGRFVLAEAVKRSASPGRIAVVISKPGFFPSAYAWQHLPDVLRRFVKLLYVQAADPNLLAKLNDFGPTALTATPTTLDNLALKADQLKLGRLRRVVTWSETLTDTACARIAAAFRVPVLDNYGSGECILLTSGCISHAGAHVNADWAILEVVDEASRPVPPGQLGHKAYLTNLANRVQPLVRYEVGDRLTMAAAPCECGNRMPRIEKIVGRSGEVLWVRSGGGHRALSAYPFQHAFEFLRDVREWQAVQWDRNRVRVRFEMLPGATLDADLARRKLSERLALAGFAGEVEVEMEQVPRLASDPATGKFRRLVSHVGPPAASGAA